MKRRSGRNLICSPEDEMKEEWREENVHVKIELFNIATNGIRKGCPESGGGALRRGYNDVIYIFPRRIEDGKGKGGGGGGVKLLTPRRMNW